MPYKNIEDRRKKSVRWHRKNVDKTLLSNARKRAMKKSIDFDLTLEDIVIPEFCPVLGIKLERSPVWGHHWPSPSLDRINPSLGYIKNNVRVISYRANTLKNNATLAELELILKDARRCSLNSFKNDRFCDCG